MYARKACSVLIFVLVSEPKATCVCLSSFMFASELNPPLGCGSIHSERTCFLLARGIASFAEKPTCFRRGDRRNFLGTRTHLRVEMHLPRISTRIESILGCEGRESHACKVESQEILPSTRISMLVEAPPPNKELPHLSKLCSKLTSCGVLPKSNNKTCIKPFFAKCSRGQTCRPKIVRGLFKSCSGASRAALVHPPVCAHLEKELAISWR